MKQLIAPIAIIVALIASLSSLATQEFSRHDDVQCVQAENQSSNNLYLSDIQYVRKARGGVIEVKTEDRYEPAETKLVAQTKLESTLAEEIAQPVAVPVVTAEEAERLNDKAKEYAITEKEKKEPFFQFYENINLESISFEGTILVASAIPNPDNNDYENCLYALLVEINSLLSESPINTIERTVLINTPIIKNKKRIETNIFKPGDKVFCTCADYDVMPQHIQEIQLSDDIQSFEHQQYYPLTIDKIKTFTKGGNKNFAKREITILPLQSLPRDEKAISSRRNRIQSEISRIESELKKHGGSFESWKEEYMTIASKYETLCKEKYKGWINDSYFAAGGTETSYSTKEYIEGILPYKNFLEENNIDLIVVRVPSKWDFAARVLASEDFQENPAWIEHYYQCLKNDIEIVDPMPEMWKERFDFPLFYFYNSQGETHPLEGFSFVSAKVLSTILKRYQYQHSEREISLADSMFRSDDFKFFWPKGNEKFNPKENITFKQVVRDNKTIGNLTISSGSPFLFLSNSFFRFPERSLGASVPGYTAFFMQAIPDWYYQDGTHNPMIRNLVGRPQLLDCRRAVVMVGHPDDWKGFPSIPRYILDKAKRITLEKTIMASSDKISINDNNSFLHSVDNNESVIFVPNDIPEQQRVNQFEMVFRISNIKEKETCMIRVNFDRTSYITLKLSVDDHIIDMCSIASGKGRFVDLFVPLSDHLSDVKILFQPKHYKKEYAIKNIELWYY